MLLGFNATEWLIIKNMKTSVSVPHRVGWRHVLPPPTDLTYIPSEGEDDLLEWEEDFFEFQQASPGTGGGGGELLPELPEMPPSDRGRKDKSKEESEADEAVTKFGRALREIESNWNRLMWALEKTIDAFDKLNDAMSKFLSTLSPSLTTLGEFVAGLGRAAGSIGGTAGFFGSLSKSIANIALGVSKETSDLAKKSKEALDTFTMLSRAFGGGGIAGGAIGGTIASTAFAGSGALVTGGVGIALAIFMASISRVMDSFGKLAQTFGHITQTIDKFTQFESSLQRLGLGLMRLPEYATSSAESITELSRTLSEAGINVRAFVETLNTALGDVQRWGALSFISFEQWAETLEGLGRLGIRADQFREVLGAAAQGRILESGGLSLPREYVESLSALNYGLVGLGESAGYAITMLEEMKLQQEALASMTDRSSLAVQAYNRIMGVLTETINSSGRLVTDVLGKPLQELASVLSRGAFAQAIRNIAEAVGMGIRGFLEGFIPLLQRAIGFLNFSNIRDALKHLEGIGYILGQLFGQLLTSIVEGLPSLMVLVRGFVDLWAGITRIARGIFDLINALRITQILGYIMTALGWVLSVIGEILTGIARFVNSIVNFFKGGWWREEPPRRPTERPAIEETTISLEKATSEFKKGMASLLDAIIHTASEAAKQASRFRELAIALANLYGPGGLPGMIAVPFFTHIPMLMQGKVYEALFPELFKKGEGTPQEKTFFEKLINKMAEYMAAPTMSYAMETPQPKKGEIEATGKTSSSPPPPVINIGIPYAQTAVSGLEIAIQPVIASYAQLAALLVNIAYMQARLNEELRGLGTVAKTDDLIKLYTQLGEQIKRIGESLKNVAQISEMFYRSWLLSYDVATSFSKLDFGLSALGRQLDLYSNIHDILKNVVSLGEIRIRQAQVEVYRLSELLGAYNVLLQQIVNVQARRLNIAPQEVKLERMSPQDLIALAMQYQIPEHIIQPIMEQLNKFYQAQMNTLEALANLGRELMSVGNTMRSAATATRELAVRFGDVNEATRSSNRVIETFNLSLEGLIRKAGAALASYNLIEYFRSLEELAQLLNERYNQLIETQTKTIAAMARPLDLTIDRFSTMISMLDKIGASALTLPQVFHSIVPAANRLLREIIAMADAWREHPEILNRILAEAERVYNRVMDLVGRASAIVPVIPITEVIRLAQMPAMMPLEMFRRPAEALGPRYELAGVPLTPSYILAQQFWASGAWIQMPELREFLLTPLDVYRTLGGMGVGEVGAQLALLRQSLAEEREGIRRRILWEGWRQRAALESLIAGGVWAGETAAEQAIARGGIGLPSIAGAPPHTLQYFPQPPQPVKLRVELENNEITLRVRFVTEGGQAVELTRRVKLTAYNPQSEALRENQ